MTEVVSFINASGFEFLILIIPALIIYCLVDILRGGFKDPFERILWLLIVLFTPLVGSLIYLALGKKRKIYPSR